MKRVKVIDKTKIEEDKYSYGFYKTERGTLVYATNEKPEGDHYFSGVVIEAINEGFPPGYCSNSWGKAKFKPVNAKITIS